MPDTTVKIEPAAIESALSAIKTAGSVGLVSASAVENISGWLTKPQYADYAPLVIQHLANKQWRELDDAFWTVIPFGTAGRRGCMYPIGTNAINDRTMGESVQGLADYVRSAPPLPLGEGRGEGAARRITVFQWHGDTFDLPASAMQLARSPQCENQAFRFGQRAFGLQFHMEVTAEIIDEWLCQSDNCGELAGLSYIDPAALRRQIPEKLPQMEAVGRQVFDRFANLCRTTY